MYHIYRFAFVIYNLYFLFISYTKRFAFFLYNVQRSCLCCMISGQPGNIKENPWNLPMIHHTYVNSDTSLTKLAYQRILCFQTAINFSFHLLSPLSMFKHHRHKTYVTQFTQTLPIILHEKINLKQVYLILANKINSLVKSISRYRII